MRKVLIIEDEPTIRKALSALLAGLNCTGDVALSGQQALDLVRRENFDAVLLDLRCSNLVPEDVVPQIHRIQPSLVGRILVITGEVSDEKGLALIENQFLIEIPRARLFRDVRSSLQVLLGIAP